MQMLAWVQAVILNGNTSQPLIQELSVGPLPNPTNYYVYQKGGASSVAFNARPANLKEEDA